MTTYRVETLDSSTAGGNTGLIFHISTPPHLHRQFLERYTSLYAERGMGDQPLEAATYLALEVYEEDSLRTEREQWILEATEVFAAAVEANKQTLRHVELILPVSGMATPLDIVAVLKEIPQLESLCVQWPFRSEHPMGILLIVNAKAIEDTILPSYSAFLENLMNLLAIHSATLKHLRISLPQPTPWEPWARLKLNLPALTPLPLLELLDLSHWSPTALDVKALLRTDADGPVPNLQHLILDCGAEISLTDKYDSVDQHSLDEPPEVEERESWPALGAVLAAREPPLLSLCAALHEQRHPFAPIGLRFRRDSLRQVLSEGGGEQGNTSTSLANLAVCTARPIQYRSVEPGAVHGAEEDDKDLFEHAPGCGHLAYPTDQRPTTGLWK
ncbi:hypothetical protein C8R46DRAFT_1227258 [Mycena filopes]|nr:hypothetical protein C8R46DRAFT_1227258 [Mycena filopes]